MTDGRVLRDALAPDDPATAAQLLPLVYNDLRRLAAHRLAHEAPGQTLDLTALVHEAYLRLTGATPVPTLPRIPALSWGGTVSDHRDRSAQVTDARPGPQPTRPGATSNRHRRR